MSDPDKQRLIREIEELAATVGRELKKERTQERLDAGRCLYRIPQVIKDVNRDAYTPKFVSFGPYHHGRPHLQPMERFKSRSETRYLRRNNVTREQVVEAMRGVKDRLLGAYGGLEALRAEANEDDPRSPLNEEAFLNIMIVDGCFAVEVIISGISLPTEAFRTHMMGLFPSDIRRDMLLLENQLPLVVFHILLNLDRQRAPKITFHAIAEFFRIDIPENIDVIGRNPWHILDLYRMCWISNRQYRLIDIENDRSATELHYAGISIRPSATKILTDISFNGGVLQLPPIRIDDATEPLLLNLMSFERLHPGMENEVSAYAFFMNRLICTSEDVALLGKMEIIRGRLSYNDQIVNMFKQIIKEQKLFVPERFYTVDYYQSLFSKETLDYHCERALTKFRIKFLRSFWKDPISFSTFWLGVVIIFILTLIQTIYAVLSYKQDSH